MEVDRSPSPLFSGRAMKVRKTHPLPETSEAPVGDPAHNACKLCAPLGACVAFRGVQGGVPFLHGSQGCATYIRRYLISHFREPVDIASSSFNEEAAVFGGRKLFTEGVRNVTSLYHPAFLGVASTCLAETIGEDLKARVREAAQDVPEAPPMVSVATPSYRGTHVTGFQDAVRALFEQLAEGGARNHRVAILPGFVSPTDLRTIKQLIAACSLDADVFPDYSDSLDGGTWDSYQAVPPGGTSLEAFRGAGRLEAALELGGTLALSDQTPAAFLQKRFGVERVSLGLPVGLAATDAFLAAVERYSENWAPQELLRERSRLVDAYVDGHKYVYGLRAFVFGDPDMVVAMTGFLAEVGVKVVLCASGTEGSGLAEAIRATTPDLKEQPRVMEGADYQDVEDVGAVIKPDLLVGPSKGFGAARALQAPLLRVGFPIHDRFGAARLRHVGYGGTLELFDRLVNLVLEGRQTKTPVGNSYQ
jgi:nitrogenase molybdenum-iron protein NifN